MAARKNKGTHDQAWDEQTRKKLQTSMLLNRLLDHCLAKKSDKDFDQKFMQQSQVNAALGLMKKVLPDLAMLTISGDPDNPFILKDISAKPLEASTTKWLEDKSNNTAVLEGETVN